MPFQKGYKIFPVWLRISHVDFKGGQIHFSRRADHQGNFSRRVKDFSCSQCSTMLNWEGLRHLFPRGGGGRESRKFISTGGEHYSRWSKTTFLRGVKTNIFTFPEGSKHRGPQQGGGGKDIKCNSPIKGMLCK